MTDRPDVNTLVETLAPHAERAEMRWMSVEEATIELPARLVAEINRVLPDLAARARDNEQALANGDRLLSQAGRQLEAAEAERDRLQGDLQSALAECGRFDAEADRLARRVTELEAARDEASTLLMVGHGLYPEGSDQNTVGQPINVGSMGWVDAAVRILRKLAGDGGGA